MRSAPAALASVRRLQVVRRARRELLETHEGGLGAGHDRPGHRVDGHVGADHGELAWLAGGAALDGHLDRGAGLAADPVDDLVDRVTGGGLAVHGHDLVAFLDPGALGRAALEHADHEGQAVRGGVDPDADPDVLAGQVARALGALLGGHERGVAGIADGLGHAVDRAVDEVAIVELIRADVLRVQGVPGFTNEPEVRRRGAVGSRGRRPEAAQGGHHQVSDPDPDAEREHQREAQDRATDHRPASATGRR